MKNINKLIRYIFLIAVVSQSACLDDTLDKSPKLSFSESNAFQSFQSTQAYAMGFYGVFEGYEPWRDLLNSEFNADFIMDNENIFGSDWVWNRINVPTSSDAWDFSTIRRINLMLANIDNSEMTELEIDHWRSVGRFFRAYDYFTKISKYGDVPWIDKVVSDTDEEILYASRTPRDEVASNILADLIYAEENILEPGTNNVLENTIGVDAVRALISRFGLFEGTWRKYHGLGDSDKYLTACVQASEKLIEDHPTLHSNYDEVFNSEDLSGVSGILFYKQYELGIIDHGLPFYNRNNSWDLSKKAVDMYLLKDGQTRWTSPLFDGDHNAFDEFRNRDRRLYYTVLPPYNVDKVVGDVADFEYTGIAADREYIDLMMTISDDKHKYLPARQTGGLNVLHTSPHFKDYNIGEAFFATRTGYQVFKYYNRITDIQHEGINDAPIFRMGEVLVNYAEAKWELGQFDQTVADLSINKLRERGDVSPMVVANIGADFDPTRDQDINPVLWEIRRERAIELMAEPFRFDDLRRWKKMDYAAEKKLGRWIVGSDYDNQIPIDNGASEGYIYYSNNEIFKEGPSFPDYYYLYPIPSNQIVLNPNIEQNPGWE
ncbi:RagB/SusD family nutrient uptake outer membrane protein [Sunxiuqinia indica]|uniref:RagB/SusD family nutrient uptake outer membrane protein n=1 Tax=Sunxiuqinia indica TaxID=2692584 RepID=UPI0013577FC8|nr:RagB/SusD family nutrient uptake outer membrane protein [Sunxiuqinia indica]